jgi:hypothetical protein
MIERQMYGRAQPDLLRKRVLLADCRHHGKCQSHRNLAIDTSSGTLLPHLDLLGRYWIRATEARHGQMV